MTIPKEVKQLTEKTFRFTNKLLFVPKVSYRFFWTYLEAKTCSHCTNLIVFIG